MKIAVLNRKGGVGKSTTAVHLTRTYVHTDGESNVSRGGGAMNIVCRATKWNYTHYMWWETLAILRSCIYSGRMATLWT